MGDHKAFFYGTLLVPAVLYRVCYGTTKPTAFQESLLTIKPAILHNFMRHKVRDCDYPGIIPSQSGSVRGTFVSGLSDGDMWRLDIFEGDEYERRPIKATLLNEVGDEDGKGNVEGDEVDGETYVWIAGDHLLEDGEWDFKHFLSEKIGSWTGERPEYDEVDKEAQKTGHDPTGGRGVNGRVSAHLEGVGEVNQEQIRSAV